MAIAAVVAVPLVFGTACGGSSVDTTAQLETPRTLQALRPPPIETITADGKPLTQEAPVLNCDPDLPTDPETVDRLIDQDIGSRTAMNLRDDRAFVESLYGGEANVETCWLDGMLFTMDEAHVVSVNQYLGDRAPKVHNAIVASPYGDQFAGLMIDNSSGTIRVNLVMDEVPEDLAQDLAVQAGGADYLTYFSAKYTWAQLNELQQRLSETTSGSADRASEVSGTSLDAGSNAVVIALNQHATPSAELHDQVEEILDDLSLDPDAVRYTEAGGLPVPAMGGAEAVSTRSPAATPTERS